MAAIQYVFAGTVVSVHDGDTVTLDLDLGFNVRLRGACRLLGINAPELAQAGGPEARDFLRSLLPLSAPVRVLSVRADKYGGRFDGVVTLPDGRSVADLMVASGHALPWDGRGPRPVPGAGSA